MCRSGYAGAGVRIRDPATAHCDGLDGPVVAAARQALDANDPNRILIWVQRGDDEETRAAFNHAVAVGVSAPKRASWPTASSSRLSCACTVRAKALLITGFSLRDATSAQSSG